MSVEQAFLRTQRGDTVMLTLFAHAGEEPSILVSLDDVDGTIVPTAELTVKEAAEIREMLRKFSEKITVEEARRRPWTNRR